MLCAYGSEKQCNIFERNIAIRFALNQRFPSQHTPAQEALYPVLCLLSFQQPASLAAAQKARI
jgi:hypothetical protein